MTNYNRKAPLSKKDIKRAKAEAKKARMNKMSQPADSVSTGLNKSSRLSRGGRGGGIKRTGGAFINKQLWIIIGAAVIALLVIGMVVFIITQQSPSEDELAAYLETGTYAQTTTIEGVDVSGKTLDEARSVLADTIESKLSDANIIFTYNGETYTETAMSFGLVTNIEDVLMDAMLFEKAGTMFERSKNQRIAESEGVSYSINVLADEDTVATAAATLLPKYTVEAEEPEIMFDPNATSEDEIISWTEEVVGLEIDQPAFITAVLNGVKEGNYNIGEVTTTVINPEHTKADVENSVVKLSEYTSFYGYGEFDDDERVFNISFMAEMLTGSTVEPGEDWSVNDTTGERTEDAGWKEAHAIRHGALEDELGGGVCQVSSTLYNAFLLADLGIVERHAHTYPSDYINRVTSREDWYRKRYYEDHIAVDATVDYASGKDLIIRNTLSDTIYIVVISDQEAETVTAQVYGPAPKEDYQIVIRTLKDKTLEPSEPTEILLADENGYAPDGTFVKVGHPYTYVSRVKGSVWVMYKYYYPKDYVMYEDSAYSWIGYKEGDEDSGEKYRMTFVDSGEYIDSIYPAIAGVVYYNPADPETYGMEGSTYDPNAVDPAAPADPADTTGTGSSD